MKYAIDNQIMKTIVKKMLNELRAMERNRIRYFKSKKFQKDFKRMKKHLTTNDYIYDESILYFPEEYPFSEREFVRMVDTIHRHSKTWQEKDMCFPHERFEYNGVQFQIVCGQGTAYTAWIDKE